MFYGMGKQDTKTCAWANACDNENYMITKTPLGLKKLERWLYVVATLILSGLLVVFAHDIENEVPIKLPSTNAGRQEMLMAVSRVLGYKGSIVVGILATGISLYYALRPELTNKKK